jgi:hypothetical protein
MAGKSSLVPELELSDIIRNITPHPDDHDQPMIVDPSDSAAQFPHGVQPPTYGDDRDDEELEALDSQEAQLLHSRIGEIKDPLLAKLVRQPELSIVISLTMYRYRSCGCYQRLFHLLSNFNRRRK